MCLLCHTNLDYMKELIGTGALGLLGIKTLEDCKAGKVGMLSTARLVWFIRKKEFEG